MANRSLRAVLIDNKGHQSLTGGSLSLNANPSSADSLEVHAMIIEHRIAFSGGAPAGTLGAATLGNTRHDWDWRMKTAKMLNNVRWSTLDLAMARVRLPGRQAYDVLTDQAISLAGTYYFRQIVWMRRQNIAVPEDGVVSLSDVGNLQITTPDLSSVVGAATGFAWQTYLTAVGYDPKPGRFRAGCLWTLTETGSDSGTSQKVSIGGAPLRDFFGYSLDPSTSPVSGDTQPKISLDNTPKALWSNYNSADLNWLNAMLRSADDYSDYVNATGVLNTLVEDLLPAPDKCKTSDLPIVGNLAIDYSARTTTPTNIVYVAETLLPSQSAAALVQRLPARIAEMSPDALRAAITRPGISELDPALAVYLPAFVAG